MTSNTTLSVVFEDPYRERIPRISGTKYEFTLSYSELPDTRSNNQSLTRSTDSTITYPVAEHSELHRLKHLSAQAAAANQRKYETPVGGLDEIRIEIEIDEIAVELFGFVRQATNTQLTSLSCPDSIAKALLLHDIWDFNSIPKLINHLHSHPAVAELVGCEDTITKSKLYQANKRLKSNSERRYIHAAATRIVHAFWRNGYPLPDQIRSGHELTVEPLIRETHIDAATRRSAVFNWIANILPPLTDHISFDRAANTSYTITDIVGSLAQAALIDGVYAAEDMAGWHYNDDDLIGGRHLTDLLSDLTIRSINNTFRDVHREFISIASELGFFSTGYDYAADTTWVNWDGDNMPELIDNPMRCETESGWCFAAVTCMNSDARFAFGINMVTDKSKIVDHYEGFLTQIARNHPINGVYMDREFTSGKAVKMCHSLTDEWVIRAKTTKGPIKTHTEEASVGEPVGPKQIDFADVTPRPKLYLHPLEEGHRDSIEGTHMKFLVSKSFEEADRDYIYQTYQNRWNIETFFRQLKHDFSPTTKTPSSESRVFLFNVGALFYNIHTLINRAPSPRYGLRLDIPYYMVLQAIVEFSFTRAGPFGR